MWLTTLNLLFVMWYIFQFFYFVQCHHGLVIIITSTIHKKHIFWSLKLRTKSDTPELFWIPAKYTNRISMEAQLYPGVFFDHNVLCWTVRNWFLPNTSSYWVLFLDDIDKVLTMFITAQVVPLFHILILQIFLNWAPYCDIRHFSNNMKSWFRSIFYNL